MTWLILESVDLHFKGVKAKLTPSIELNNTQSYETQNSLEKFKSKVSHTHSTVPGFHQNRLHSQDPHHTAIGWGHTGHCCTQSQTQHMSSSLQRLICRVKVESYIPTEGKTAFWYVLLPKHQLPVSRITLEKSPLISEEKCSFERVGGYWRQRCPITLQLGATLQPFLQCWD